MLNLVDYTKEATAERHKIGYKLSREYWNKFETDLLTRARKLTEANIWIYSTQYDLYQSFSNIFDFENVYKQSIEDKLVINFFIGISSKEEKSLDKLCLDYDISVDKKHALNNVIVYEFFYEIDSNNIYKTMESVIGEDPYFDIAQHPTQNKEERYAGTKENIKKILNTASPSGTMNIPAFNFFISFTPLRNIFKSINYQLIDPYSKLRTSKYIILNNGKEIYGFGGGITLNELEYKFKLSEPSYYEELEEVFRSTWEANVARIFNHIDINWKYEKEALSIKSNKEDNNERRYTPDFILSDFNTIIEVKGFWDDKSITSYTSAKEKYIKHNFIHIDKDIYYLLDKHYKYQIPNWIETKFYITPSNIPIVGVTIKERIPFVKKLKQDDVLVFKRDQNNPYDKNAIQVLNDAGNQIGFVAKEWASIISEKLDMGISYNITVSEINTKVIFVTAKMIDIENDVVSKLLSRILNSKLNT